MTDMHLNQTPPLDVGKYLPELCSELGVDPHELSGTGLDFTGCTTKRGVNIKFMAWFKERNIQKAFTPESANLFKTLVNLRDTAEIQAMKSDQAQLLSSAKDRIRQSELQLGQAAKISLKLAAYSGNEFVDLTEEIKEIVKDGWYTYEDHRTKEHNLTNSDKALVFTTQPVYMQWFNPRANVNLKVLMGKFKVTYSPATGNIKVNPCSDNLMVDGYFHPHIGDRGSVCWGNAADTHARATRDFKPSKSFGALRVILQTYNDESPYTSLTKFHTARTGERVDGEGSLVTPPFIESQGSFFLAEDDTQWVMDSDLEYTPASSDIIDTAGHEEDDEPTTEIRVYTRYDAPSMSAEHDDETYYMRDTRGRFHAVDV